MSLQAEGLDAPLPQVSIDPDRFGQVMANLLSNAIKHSPAGAPVRVRLAPTALGLRVSVQDSGPGVAPNLRKRLFEKLSQADGSDRRAQGGTGLGLYISRMLVERMGGRISADVAVDAASGGTAMAAASGDPTGSGACFSIEFPAVAHPAGTPEALS